MKRIERALMAELVAEYGTADTPRVYHDRRWLVRELFWRAHEKMLALSRPPSRHRVLDFGGGNGVLLPTLSTLFDEVVCLDLNADVAREIVRRFELKNVEIMSGDIFRLALPADHFDTVVAASVLEHIEDLPRLAAEMARIIVFGGELLTNAPTENRFYEMGRRVFGYVKPPDHYHNDQFVTDVVGAHLVLKKMVRFPVNWAPLGVFGLLRFVKETGG